jgi:hypothetical protein
MKRAPSLRRIEPKPITRSWSVAISGYVRATGTKSFLREANLPPRTRPVKDT